jgi:peroxiredoxin
MILFALIACAPHLYSTNETDTTPWSWDAPVNDWPTSEPPDDLVGDEWAAGHVAPDFRLVDQNGDEVALWQFYGDVVLVDVCTMWCAPCRELAEGAQAITDDYADRGGIYVTVLAEDVTADPPEHQDLVDWADYFGIVAPVLADGDKAITSQIVSDANYPAFMVVGRDMVIRERVAMPTSDEALRAAIDRAL